MDHDTATVDPQPFESVPHWLLMDPDLTAPALRVWLVLQKHRNYETGTAWPGRRRLASLASMSVKTVDRALANLEAVGAVTITRRKNDDGSYGSNLYRVHWERWGKSDATLGTKTTLGVGTKTTHELIPNMNEDPVNEKDSPPSAMFDGFWNVYPRKIGKGQARKAFAAACKKADVLTIMAGVVQYAEWCEEDGTETRFIAHPATWLNGERWTDERRTDPKPLSNMQAHMALIREIAHNEGYQVAPELEAGGPSWT